MARRSAGDQAAELDDFLSHLPPQPPPKNLGNIPDDVVSAQTPARPDGVEPEVRRAESDQPELPLAPPEPEPAVAAAETDEGEEPSASPDSDRLAELEARLANVQRENEFFRRGYTAAQTSETPAAPQITPDTILPFDVTDDDLQGILAGGPKSAQMIRDALRATAYAGAVAAVQYLSHAYQQTRTQETTSQQLRDSFYAQHPDLQSYPEIVTAAAQQVAGQYPHADAQALIVATGQRARARLREMGVVASPAAPAARAARRAQPIRPASAEMASGRGANGSVRLTPVERDILDLYQTR